MGYWRGSQTGRPTSNLAFLQSILHRVEQMVWRIPQMHATDHGTDGGGTDTGQTERFQVFSSSKLSRTPAPSASPTTPPRSSPSLGCLHNGLLFKIFPATSPLLYTPEPSLFSLQQPPPTSMQLLYDFPIFFGTMEVLWDSTSISVLSTAVFLVLITK